MFNDAVSHGAWIPDPYLSANVGHQHQTIPKWNELIKHLKAKQSEAPGSFGKLRQQNGEYYFTPNLRLHAYKRKEKRKYLEGFKASTTKFGTVAKKQWEGYQRFQQKLAITEESELQSAPERLPVGTTIFYKGEPFEILQKGIGKKTGERFYKIKDGEGTRNLYDGQFETETPELRAHWEGRDARKAERQRQREQDRLRREAENAPFEAAQAAKAAAAKAADEMWKRMLKKYPMDGGHKQAILELRDLHGKSKGVQKTQIKAIIDREGTAHVNRVWNWVELHLNIDTGEARSCRDFSTKWTVLNITQVRERTPRNTLNQQSKRNMITKISMK